MKQTEKQVQAVNVSIGNVSRELKRLQKTCDSNGSPIRSITFRVFDDGETKLHVTYRRK